MYKSDTNTISVLQLLCVVVHEQIKGALSLCLVTLLCGWSSRWRALFFMPLNHKQICHGDSHYVQILYTYAFNATKHLATWHHKHEQ